MERDLPRRSAAQRGASQGKARSIRRSHGTVARRREEVVGVRGAPRPPAAPPPAARDAGVGAHAASARVCSPCVVGARDDASVGGEGGGERGGERRGRGRRGATGVREQRVGKRWVREPRVRERWVHGRRWVRERWARERRRAREQLFRGRRGTGCRFVSFHFISCHTHRQHNQRFINEHGHGIKAGMFVSS